MHSLLNKLNCNTSNDGGKVQGHTLVWCLSNCNQHLILNINCTFLYLSNVGFKPGPEDPCLIVFQLSLLYPPITWFWCIHCRQTFQHTSPLSLITPEKVSSSFRLMHALFNVHWGVGNGKRAEEVEGPGLGTPDVDICDVGILSIKQNYINKSALSGVHMQVCGLLKIVRTCNCFT